MSGFGLHLKLGLGSGNGGGAIASVAAWILNMLGLGQGNGSTSTTDNATVSVIANTDAVTDGFTIVEIPDAEDIGIQNGAQLNTTTWQYSYTTQDGTNTKLALTQGLQTDNGTVETLVPMNPWSAGASVVAGQVVKVSTTEGIDCHVEYVSSGTSAGSQPVTSISDIGGSAVTDNDTSYLVKGYQTVEGLFSGLAATNVIINSELDGAVAGTPGTAPTGWTVGLANGTVDSVTAVDIGNAVKVSATAARHYYQQSMTAAANTDYVWSGEVIETSGETVDELLYLVSPPAGSTISVYANGVVKSAAYVPVVGDMLEIRLAVAGTAGTVSTRFGIGVSGAVTGSFSCAYLQFEAGTLRTPYVPTSTTTETRTATVTSEPLPASLTPEYGAGLYIGTPRFTGGASSTLFASSFSGTEYVGSLMIATQIRLLKFLGASNYQAQAPYTHAAGQPFAFIWKYGSGGMDASAADLGSAFPLVTHNANNEDAILGSTLETGSRVGASQFSGQIIDNATGDWNDMVALAESFGMDVSNLVLE